MSSSRFACILSAVVLGVGRATREPSPTLTPPELAATFVVSEGTRDDGALAKWWQQFGDTALAALVDRAIARNQDIAIAAARLEQARAGLSGANAALWPKLDVATGVTRQRASLEDPQISAAADAPGFERDQTSYRASTTISWEIDLFGRSKARADSQRERGVAAEAAQAATALMVASDVAQTVIAARTLQERLRLAHLAVETETDLGSLTKAKVAGGQLSQSDVLRAEALVFDSMASASRLESDLAATVASLAVLIASTPAETVGLLGSPSPMTAPSPFKAAGLPADLLTRRPDILQAAALFRASTFDRSAAERDRYPVLQIAGTLALVAGSTATLGTSDALLASIGPSVGWRALDFGRLEAAIDQAVGSEKELLIRYKQLVLRAFAGTEQALSDLNRRDKTLAHAGEALGAQRQAWELMRVQFDGGIADATSLLDRRRSLTRPEETFAIAAQQKLNAAVVAYRALGGGW